MNGLSFYIARQVTVPFVFFTLALTALVWLTQSLRVLDVIINQGQSAATFVQLAVFLLPSLLALLLPIALFLAVVFALHRLQMDSELVVMWSAGMSGWNVAKPVLLVSLAVALAVYGLNLYLMPAGMRAFKDRVFEIRGDLLSVFLREGNFTTPVDNITVYVRETSSSGELQNLLVHDERNPDEPTTYLAARGRIARTDEGPRLVMWDGTVQRLTDNKRMATLDFDRYTFDLSQFNEEMSGQIRETSERYLHELLFPDPTNYWDSRYWNRLVAEGHSRLASPLYAIALAMIGLAAIMSGHFVRRGSAGPIAVAVLATLVVRLAGVGLQSAATRVAWMNVLQYLFPLAVIFGTAMLFNRGLVKTAGKNSARLDPGLQPQRS